METFADYILNEKSLGSKMEIMYYLSKKENVFFDKTAIFKTEILRMFINSTDLGLDMNLLLTASLLASCKKIQVSSNLEKVKSFSKEGAQYLYQIGFDDRFCKICEGINRYTEQPSREKESDVLELVDQFGGMLLDRPERIGMDPEEALVLLEHRNLKDKYNRYMHSFIEFINKLQKIKIREDGEKTPLQILIDLYRQTPDEKRFITAVIYEYEAKVDEAICKNQCEQYFKFRKNMHRLEKGDPNRPLFSEETTKKVIGRLIENKKE